MSGFDLPGDFSLYGTRVDVYRNLHEDCYSIRSRETDSDEYGNVIGHAHGVLLRDAEFVVQEAGQAKCRETGVKNVHAVVRGELQYCFDRDEDPPIWEPFKRSVDDNNTGTVVSVRYDPFECDHFEVSDTIAGKQEVEDGGSLLISGYEIEGATYVLIGPQGVEAYIDI